MFGLRTYFKHIISLRSRYIFSYLKIKEFTLTRGLPVFKVKMGKNVFEVHRNPPGPISSN